MRISCSLHITTSYKVPNGVIICTRVTLPTMSKVIIKLTLYSDQYVQWLKLKKAVRKDCGTVFGLHLNPHSKSLLFNYARQL